MEQKFYQKTVFIIFMCIFFFPIGLFLIWKNPFYSKTSKKLGIGAFCLLILISVATSPKDKPAPVPSSTVSSSIQEKVEDKAPSSPPPVTTSTNVQQEAQTSAPVENQQPTERKYTGQGPNGEGIKGHIDKKKGTMIYHLPGDPYYSRTTHVSQWFFTEKEAKAAGYRPILR